ncbi:BON domain protein [Stieleria bergensis]|uniref:BON domain protein n=1 Tax=Stieleria bergensis TaxID=2528025 RepID=A0A517SZ60_9BACT|nr:BON domain protein [Planctomycetes bacterium SV_7m_r]
MTQADSTQVALYNAPLINESTVSGFDEKSQALECAIQQAGHRGLDRVRVTLLDGWIVLRGRVSSFYLKQLAQEAVRPMAIGMQIRNELHVDH